MSDLLYDILDDGVGVDHAQSPRRLNAITFAMLEALGRGSLDADRDDGRALPSCSPARAAASAAAST